MPATPPEPTFGPRLRSLFWLVFVAYVAYVAWMWIGGYQAAAEGRRPWYTDFTHTYAGAMLLRDLPAEALYVDRAFMQWMYAAAEAAFGPGLSWGQSRAINFSPWMYPPTFLFLVAPLGYLPYLAAYLGWVVLTGAVYLTAMRGILRDAGAWPFALVLPTTYSNLMFGQTGFLSAGLIGLGLSQIRPRPWLAGVLIGIASVKPHLGLLIPIALAAGGYWRVFGAATATVVALVLASAAVFGLEPWFATLGSIGFYVEGFELGGYNLYTLTSVLSTVRLPGGSAEAMWAAQNVALGLAALLVAGVWRRGRQHPQTLGLQSAVLCFATPLAVASVYVYDLAILAPGAAWLWLSMRRQPGGRWETVLFALALAWPMFTYEFARLSELQLGPVSPLVLLGLALRRFVQESRSPVPRQGASNPGCLKPPQRSKTRLGSPARIS